MGVAKRTMKVRERKAKEVKQTMSDTDTVSKPTMRPVSLDEIPQRTVQGKAGPFVEEFLSSGAEAAIVENAKKGFTTTLRRYLKENGAPASVKTVNGQTYIVRS